MAEAVEVEEMQLSTLTIQAMVALVVLVSNGALRTAPGVAAEVQVAARTQTLRRMDMEVTAASMAVVEEAVALQRGLEHRES